MISFWNDSITVLRSGSKLSRGQNIPDWSNPTKILIEKCNIQPGSTSMSQDGRVLGITDGLTVYVPETADVVEGDHVEVDGSEYSINGKPLRWKSPTGELDHIQLNLVRWDG